MTQIFNTKFYRKGLGLFSSFSFSFSVQLNNYNLNKKVTRKVHADAGRGTLLDTISNRFSTSCKESRIETNNCFYGCYYLGPFEQGESVTIANALRRTLLSDLVGVAITSVEIEGAVHEYASITGVRESVLDILLNLKEITLKQTTPSSSTTFTPSGNQVKVNANHSILTPDLLVNPTEKKVVLSQSKVAYLERKKKGWGNQVGYLRARGPGVVKASDLKLPPYIVCVDPEQYIATLSDDGVLNMKFYMSEGKNYLIQVPNKNVHVKQLKILQNKVKRAGNKGFVRYAPFKITSHMSPLAESGSGFPGVKSFFNLRKQKTVFNQASTGSRLPIDAVFMPVTKVNYMIEPDEQSNDQQFNGEPFNDPARVVFPADATESSASVDPSLAQKLAHKSEGKHFGTAPVSSMKPSLPVGLPVLSRTPEIAQHQNSGVISEQQQRAFSRLLVNPLLKTQSPSLFVKKVSATSKRSDVNFTFLHPAPFLSVQDKLSNVNHNEALTSGYEAKQQELLLTTVKEQVVAQPMFTKKYPLKFKIILEIWTNGSIHPRKALYDSYKSIVTLFSRLQQVRILGSMLKSERFYNKLIEKKFATKTVPLASQSPLIQNLNSESQVVATDTWLETTEGSKNSKHTSPHLVNISVSSIQPHLDTVIGKTKSKKLSALNKPNKTVTSSQTSTPAALPKVEASSKSSMIGGALPNTGSKTHRVSSAGENGGESVSHTSPPHSPPAHLDLLPIESLNLSLRSYTCLKRSNIDTINDLMGHSKKQLIQIKNFGVHSLEEIQIRLGAFGFKLKR